jgi:small nuclear ribonucleoprotein (snRNP)-like protein
VADQQAAELTRDSRIGDRVTWRQVNGERFVGTLRGWDSNVALVMLDDGTSKAVEC